MTLDGDTDPEPQQYQLRESKLRKAAGSAERGGQAQGGAQGQHVVPGRAARRGSSVQDKPPDSGTPPAQQGEQNRQANTHGGRATPVLDPNKQGGFNSLFPNEYIAGESDIGEATRVLLLAEERQSAAIYGGYVTVPKTAGENAAAAYFNQAAERHRRR